MISRRGLLRSLFVAPVAVMFKDPLIEMTRQVSELIQAQRPMPVGFGGPGTPHNDTVTWEDDRHTVAWEDDRLDEVTTISIELDPEGSPGVFTKIAELQGVTWGEK